LFYYWGRKYRSVAIKAELLKSVNDGELL